jgi:hypothetical protein
VSAIAPTCSMCVPPPHRLVGACSHARTSHLAGENTKEPDEDDYINATCYAHDSMREFDKITYSPEGLVAHLTRILYRSSQIDDDMNGCTCSVNVHMSIRAHCALIPTRSPTLPKTFTQTSGAMQNERTSKNGTLLVTVIEPPSGDESSDSTEIEMMHNVARVAHSGTRLMRLWLG